LAFYALKKTESMIAITQSAVKFMGLAMALPVGLICGFAPQLLTIWVGAEYAYLAPLMVLLTAHLAINVSVKPLFPINVAHNRVMIPGLMTILFGVLNLVLSIAIPLMTGWGYYGVAVAGAIALTFRHTLFVPWYAARVLKIRMATYLKSIIPGAVAMLIIAGTTAGIATRSPLSPLFTLIITGVVITIVYGIIVLEFGLTSFERRLFNSYLPQGWKRVHRIIGFDNRD
jgi:O-antigen/teichoic acid export membrane protein